MKVKNRNTRTMREICSKFMVNSEQISHILLMFPLVTLNTQVQAFKGLSLTGLHIWGTTKTYLRACQTFMMELFTKTVNGLIFLSYRNKSIDWQSKPMGCFLYHRKIKPLTIFPKNSSLMFGWVLNKLLQWRRKFRSCLSSYRQRSSLSSSVLSSGWTPGVKGL